jgi:hypothetical protein
VKRQETTTVTIDISAHLRRLVLAGLPVLGGACQGSSPTPAHTLGTEPPRTALAPQAVESPSCRPRRVFDQPNNTNGTLHTVAVGFDANDTRVADLYQACVTDGDFCARVCTEVFHFAPLGAPPPGKTIGQPLTCDLGCDSKGRPVARFSYAIFVAPVPGRRPIGFTDPVADASDPEVAAFFSACAQLEGASIAAFQILADELRHHGAPQALVDRARAAARDEARHFKLTARLARRFGAGRVRCPRVTRRPERDLLSVALENATEGCVSESFAAAVALHQAATASDPGVRAVMATIAEDELLHAQLAWDVHAWATDRLDRADRDRVVAARALAGHRLLVDAGRAVPAELVRHAGLPDAASATRMAAAALPLWA